MPPWILPIILLTCRLVAGGALLLAGFLKTFQDPRTFALSVDSFGMVPQVVIPMIAHYLPVLEIAVGLVLVLGIWWREGALLAAGLYTVFLAAVIWVVLSGKSLDCGCFSALFGKGEIGIQTIFRNVIFLATASLVMIKGPGWLAMEQLLKPRS